MPPDEIAAIRDDNRVTRLFTGRARERDELRADAVLPSNDIGPGAHNHRVSADLRARLDDALEQRLREPFSHIRMMTAVLKDDLTIGHTQQLSDIGKAAERGEAMLTDMLDFLRTMDGGISIARRRVDLKVVCERVVDAIHSNNPDRAMLFTSDSRVEGQWDPDRMAILVSKLVINAIDHSPAWPAVRVELRSLPDQAVLIVWNAGSIAQPEAAHRLFDPFVCGHMRRPTGSEGLGLGLFLAREIAHAHGGRIEVLSGDADGTTFRVTVPRE